MAGLFKALVRVTAAMRTAGKRGTIAQCPDGDTIRGKRTEQENRVFTNAESSAPIVIGQPVYMYAASSCKLAQADDSDGRKVVGLCRSSSITASESGIFCLSGNLNAMTDEWDAVIEGAGTGGLTAGSLYYLSETVGQITATAPATAASYVVCLGRATSTTNFCIKIESAILLT
jgi:hypothetical protein